MPVVMDAYQKLLEQARQAVAEKGESGKAVIQVGSATCENAAGAREVLQEFRKHIAASGRSDIAVRQTGCTGRCSREPIVNVMLPGRLPVKYDRVDRDAVHEIFTKHVMGGEPVAERILDAHRHAPPRIEAMFCAGIRCGRAQHLDFAGLFRQLLAEAGVQGEAVNVIEANCFGLCRTQEMGNATHLLLRPSNVIYRITCEADVRDIVNVHIKGGKVVERLLTTENAPIGKRFFQLYGDVPFFNRQSRIALRNSGIIDPESILEYLTYSGFEAMAMVLDRNDRQWVIDEVTRSKLRGRGGAGYPTGSKWKLGANAAGPVKYIICNADEGDPGAYMDRSMLEGDPFSVLEGMVIGAFAIGASRGFLYIRAEYPMAIKRIELAITQMRKYGLLGENILGSGFSFDLEIRLGAGAFVCGEETALINSIEGNRGQPEIRPPYPTDAGLWGKPTVINNVETFANVPVVIIYGAEWFSSIGTEKSGGTKVFSLTGKVAHTGLVEVPMGTTLREVVFGIGGGVSGGKALKAVQTGGPAGGVLPAEWIDTIVDFDTLMKAGSIMGSGGMIVMDEDDCMVDIARFYMTFSQDESCGKCTPCREGCTRMVEILDRITTGLGTMEDLGKLERLGKMIKKASLCGLGRAAPNPVLSTLLHFRKEYEAHVLEKRCPSNRCKALAKGAAAPAAH